MSSESPEHRACRQPTPEEQWALSARRAGPRSGDDELFGRLLADLYPDPVDAAARRAELDAQAAFEDGQ